MSVQSAENEALAADFALGLCEGESEAKAERLMMEDRVFSMRVQDWRERLLEIDLSAPERHVTPDSWAAIAGRLDEALVTPHQPATAPRASSSLRLWDNLNIWRPLALAAGFVLFLGLSWFLTQPPQAPALIAILETPEGRPGAVVNINADGVAALVPLQMITAGQERLLEVWTLQSREQGPISVGRMLSGRRLKLDLSNLNRPEVGHLFEITIEPLGGSPTGKPTGPVVMKGLAVAAL